MVEINSCTIWSHKVYNNGDENMKTNPKYLLKMIMPGIRLLLFGTIFYLALNVFVMEDIDLIYPYLTYEIIANLSIVIIIGYFLPGASFILLSPFGKYRKSKVDGSISLIPKILLTLTGLMACVGILGIESGVGLLLDIYEKKDDSPIAESGEKVSVDGEKTAQSDLKDLRLYLSSSSFYLFVWGILLLAIIQLMLVITIALAYPTINQKLMIGIEIFIWVGIMVPAIFAGFVSIWMLWKKNDVILKRQNQIMLIASVLGIIGIMGISMGLNYLKERKKLQIHN